MRLEELHEQWQRLDQKLDQSLALQTELARRLVMQPARQRVTRMAVWPAIDIVACVGGLLLCGAFLGGHWRDWRLVAPASVVMLCGIALLISSILQLDRVSRLDWSGPVAEIQGSLERLRSVKIQQFKWIILLSPLLGFCGLMVGLHWLVERLSDHRVNIFDKLDPSWIVGNYIFGVLFVPLGYFVARLLAERCQGYRWWQAVLDDISGRSLKAAALDVGRWASLVREAPGDND